MWSVSLDVQKDTVKFYLAGVPQQTGVSLTEIKERVSLTEVLPPYVYDSDRTSGGLC